jgi:hypothetical protein
MNKRQITHLGARWYRLVLVLTDRVPHHKRVSRLPATMSGMLKDNDPNLSRRGFFHAVVGEMLLQGFTPDDIGKVGGGNFCRVLGKVTAGHV